MDGRYIRRDGRYLKSNTQLSSDGVSVGVRKVTLIFTSRFAVALFPACSIQELQYGVCPGI